MKLPRLSVWQGMAMVAALAVSARYLGSVGTLELLIFLTLTAVPIALAPRGKRLRVSAWVAALYPTLPLLWLYLFWLIVWIYWGHAPRWGLDDSAMLSRITGPKEVLIVLLLGQPISPFAALLLTALSAQRESGPETSTAYDVAPIIGMILAWVGTVALLIVDPLGILDWLE